MSAEFWAAIDGAIVGSLSAGVITWLLQRNQDRRQSHDRNTGLARSLIFKLVRMYSDLAGFKNHITEGEANAKQNNLKLGWQSLRAIGNLPERVSFSPEEMGYLLSLGNDDLFNKVLSLDVVHSSTIGIFELYKERRLALTDSLAASKMEGTVGTSELNEAEMAFFAPKFAELDLLVTDMKSRAEVDAKECRTALEETAIAARKTLGPTFSIALDKPRLSYCDPSK